jgi:hypothetical protein
MCKRFGFTLLAMIFGFASLEFVEAPSASGLLDIITPAYAVVGRPLTPMSYAGVARRTARRCAAGVYYC